MNQRKHLEKLKRVVSLLLIIVMSVASVVGCSSGSNTPTITPGSSILPIASKAITDESSANSDYIEILGVLTYVDTAGYKMHYVDTESGSEYEVTYSGGTDIQNRYGAIIAAATMTLGAVYDVKCNKSGKAQSIYESDDVWESSGITGLGIDEASMIMTIGSTNYKYNNRTVVLSNSSRINVAEIMDDDKVTARGVGKTIYSVTVDKGHGYVSFTGIDSFIGGYADIGTTMVYVVTGGMVVTAPEGEYSIQVQKGSTMAAKTVVVERDKNIEVDFSEYKTEATKTGSVLFSVTPTDAVMYIDGKQVDYSELVTLSYGKHTVTLNANNYSQYVETFTVNSTYTKKIIDMTSTSSTTSTKSSTTSTTSANKTTVTDLTSGYSVNIKAPAGAAVYVDSVYIGIAPVSFSKSSGKKVITVTQSGYATKSYTIEIANTTGDLNYSFPDMVPETTTETTAATSTAS